MSGRPLEVRRAHLEGGYQQLEKRLGDLALRLDVFMAQVDARLAQIELRLDASDGGWTVFNGG
ncbi:MAG: hypothetical protein ABSF08_09430 [Candidatus Cybelea sp.]|jgi:hypothetical protein